ncbi:hypothetical protein [Thiohalophilus sp.]|uniref:hypothetical protein n=1 Tax=Thiohalophilus sp. TaxID=3028392 RepID=UPI0039749A11
MTEIRNIIPLNPGWSVNKSRPTEPTGDRKQRPGRQPGRSPQQPPDKQGDPDNGSQIDEYA